MGGERILWRWSALDGLAPRIVYEVLALRQRVFVVEQTCFYLDADGRDLDAVHLLGREAEDGPLVAYLRAFPPDGRGDAVIGRVVTAPEVRGQGLGRPLMREGIARTWETWGRTPIRISAQAHLASFYGSLGFAVCGPGYDEDGIAHVPMRLTQG